MELDHRFNTRYFINEIINDLVANLKATGTFPDEKWYRLHLDNARPHTSQTSVDYIDRHKLVRIPYHLYSPNLTPSDFYPFECRKGRLAKCYGTTKEEFSRNVTEILDSMSEEMYCQFARIQSRIVHVYSQFSSLTNSLLFQLIFDFLECLVFITVAVEFDSIWKSGML
jgi:hypothetical protein